MAASSDRCTIGFGDSARGGVIFSGGLEARGSTARFWSGAGAEDQHRQSSAGSYPDSRTAEEAPVEDVLRRNGQWRKGDTISGFGAKHESISHFQRFDRQNWDRFAPLEIGET